ncbi:MAG: hypothetical protein WA118_01110 [Carboxydocellales bacterium]
MEIIAGIVIGQQLLKLGVRKVIDLNHDSAVKTIMTDPYHENMWEFISATTRVTPQVIVETNLRTQEGKVIQRPMGSPKKFPSLDDLLFNIAQFHVMPTPLETPINTRVTFGKNRPKLVTVGLKLWGRPLSPRLTKRIFLPSMKWSPGELEYPWPMSHIFHLKLTRF